MVLSDDGFEILLGLRRHMFRPRDNRRRERVLAARRSARPSIRATASAMAFCAVAAFCNRLAIDEIDGDRIVIGMPAIVVGHQRHRRVTDLRFARELGLLQVRHPDDVHPPGAVQPFDSASVENCGPSIVDVRAARCTVAPRRAARHRRPRLTGRRTPDARTPHAQRARRPKNVLMRPRVRSKN